MKVKEQQSNSLILTIASKNCVEIEQITPLDYEKRRKC